MTNLRPYEPGRDPLTGYVTRDGRKVRILATDMKKSNGTKIVGLVSCEQTEGIQSWHEDGSVIAGVKHDLDLMCAPELRTIWLNIYDLGAVYSYETKEKAHAGTRCGCIACIKVTFTEGEGL
ncbi:MAG TPA: hypothetical protein VFG62_26015 [Rhodopila sp.]|jgi:hypothetical protein|nr:hypothetical protein [Rhodopila sp.]